MGRRTCASTRRIVVPGSSPLTPLPSRCTVGVSRSPRHVPLRSLTFCTSEQRDLHLMPCARASIKQYPCADAPSVTGTGHHKVAAQATTAV